MKKTCKELISGEKLTIVQVYEELGLLDLVKEVKLLPERDANKLTLDYTLLARLMQLGSTQEECAFVFNCSS